MTEFPTLCVLHYDHPDDASVSDQPIATAGLRLQGPRRPRSRSRTHPRRERFGSPTGRGDRLHLWAQGVNAGGDGEVKTPYRYSSSKSSCSHTPNEDRLIQPEVAYSLLTTPEPCHHEHTHNHYDHICHQHHHQHRSLSEPPPHATKRAHTAPASALSLPVLRQGGAGETSLTVNAELLQDPKWNEYLSAWVSGNKVSSHAFVSFVGAMSLKGRGRYHYTPKVEELPALPCPRFFEHMTHIQAPKILWKEKKKKNLKKPEFWTWKGRTPPKVPKPRLIRKRVCVSQACSSRQLVQVSPPSSAQFPVDIPSCSQESEESPTLTPISDHGSLSTPAPFMREPSPDRTHDEALPGIEEYSEPSDYESLTSVSLKLHKLEGPPASPSTVDWDQHSYLQVFDDDYDQDHQDHKANKDRTDDNGNHANQDDKDGALNVRQKHAASGPLATSKVDQSSYMYNDHIVTLEPLVFDAYSPLDNSSDVMQSTTVTECEPSIVEPYPLEGPLQPIVTDIDRVIVQRSSILTRPELPSPPILKELASSSASASPKEHTPPPQTPTPPPPKVSTPPPPEVPSPPPPKVPTLPPVGKLRKKPAKPKRPLKKEKTKVIKAVEIPTRAATPVSIMAQVETPTFSPFSELERIQTPTTESISPMVTEESPFLVSSPDGSKESEPENTEESASTSSEPDDATSVSPEEASATPAFSSTTTPMTATPPPLPLPSSPAERDMSLAQELERQRLAEERHRKAVLMYDKLRTKQPIPIGKMDEDADSLMEYGWLMQFCILKPEKLKMYHMAFDTVDENHRGWLSCFDTLIALKGITGTQNLTVKEEEYICRILEIAGYNILDGADFRIFSIMAALSQKLASVDQWVRNLIQKFDLQMLDWKMYRAKELFEWCIDSSTNCLSISHLLIELQAGGVNDEHLDEVRAEFGVDGTLDLIDFLTYLPLFIMTHKSVVLNPLSDIRDK